MDVNMDVMDVMGYISLLGIDGLNGQRMAIPYKYIMRWDFNHQQWEYNRDT